MLLPSVRLSFVSSSKQLYSHLSSTHVGDVKHFEYDCKIPVSFTASKKFVVLQEKKEGVVFILNNALQIMGNVIMVSCIGPSSKGGYFYELSANSKGNSLIFRSFTPCFRSRVDNPPSVRFLLVPAGFFGSGEKVTLDLCIWRKDAYSFHHPK
jgi:E3 ubiquitin-protein ligase SIAH1